MWRGLALQITYTRPLRRMIWQSRQRFLTETWTFIAPFSVEQVSTISRVRAADSRPSAKQGRFAALGRPLR